MLNITFVVVAVVYLIESFVHGSPKCNIRKIKLDKPEPCGFMHISITTRRKLAINWSFAKCKKHADEIILYKRKSCGGHEKLHRVKVSKRNKVGFETTDISWNLTKFPKGWRPDDRNESRCHCYKYYLMSYRKGSKLDRQCLQVNPTWMASNEKYLKSLRLGRVFLPGTYRSGAIGRRQNYNFWGQLVFGIRYFDITVGKKRRNKNKTETIISRAGSLNRELEHVRNFLNRTEKEVIILDFGVFNGFRMYDDHDKLISQIKEYIDESLMVHRDFSNHKDGPTLKRLWKAKKRVIINYRNKTVVERYDFLWNNILVKSGRRNTSEELKRYLLTEIPNLGYNETMSSVIGVVGNKRKSSIRNMADIVNHNIPNWYRTNNIQRHMNIIAVDFFEGSRITLDAVWINKYHKGKHKNLYEWP